MNHIQNIEIQNFKSIKHCVIDGCKRINVFVGPPNVGKSNILEAMGLFSLIESNSRSSNLNDYVRYDTVSSLFYEKNIEYPFLVKLNQKFGVGGIVRKNKEAKYFQLNHYNNLDQKYSIEPYNIGFALQEDYKLKTYKTNSSIKQNAMAISFGYNNISKEDIQTILEFSNVKKYNFDSETILKDYNSLELYVPTGENIGTFLAFQNGKLYEAIQALVAPNTFEIESNGNIRYKKKKEDAFSISFGYNEIADTLQRLIFHLTAIMSNKDSVLLFEEPEAHCYEPYVLDITNAIKYDKQNNQYFIVTHSQYIVSEFLRDEESRSNTNIYLVGLDEDGATKVKLLDRDKSDDVYQYGTNVFFNYESLWNEN